MSPKVQGTPKDEQAIREMATHFVAAWNKNDAKALAGFFASDGDLINPAGRLARGKGEVEKLLTEEQTTRFKGTRMNLSVKHVRYLSADLAVSDSEYEITGIRTPEGREITLKGLLTNVLRKEGEQWRIAAARPMVPAPMPGA